MKHLSDFMDARNRAQNKGQHTVEFKTVDLLIKWTGSEEEYYLIKNGGTYEVGAKDAMKLFNLYAKSKI